MLWQKKKITKGVTSKYVITRTLRAQKLDVRFAFLYRNLVFGGEAREKVFVSALHCCQHLVWGRGKSGWLRDVSQLSGWIIGSPKYTRHLLRGLYGGSRPHQMRHNPVYSWTDKTTSHLMLGLGKALRWCTIWANLRSEHLSFTGVVFLHLKVCTVGLTVAKRLI